METLSKIKKTILIAINPKADADILAEFFNASQKKKENPFSYKLLSAQNGKQALDFIFSENPNLAVISTELPVINGNDVCRILKNTDSFSSIPVILFSNEDSGFKFWAQTSKCNAFFVSNEKNQENIVNEVNSLLLANKKNSATAKKIKLEEDCIELVTKAYDRELWELYLTKNAYENTNLISDLFALVMKTCSDLSKIFAFDVIAIIVNENQVLEYYEKSGSISKDDFEDFKKICHSDFEKRFPERVTYDWNITSYRENEIDDFEEKHEKIMNYSVFPLEENDSIPFLIQIGNCSETAFDDSTLKKIDTFTKIYSTVISKSVIFRRAVKKESQLRRLFCQYLPEDIINKKLSGEEKSPNTQGVQKRLAILVADIRNFTSITENLEPNTVVKFLNKFFTKLGKIIVHYGGTINKYMGDSLMALFGASDDSDNNGYKAAMAAVEIQKEISNFDQNTLGLLQLKEGQEFRVGIGIHYGKPIVGEIGSEERKDYTVVGDDVNLVSRIESLTKIFGVKIIITEDVKKDVDEINKKFFSQENPQKKNFYFRSLGKVKVVGKEKVTRIFELFDNPEKYSETYLANYKKGLHQFILGSMESSLKYFNEAQKEMAGLDTEFMISQVNEMFEAFRKNPALEKNWDGSIKMLRK